MSESVHSAARSLCRVESGRELILSLTGVRTLSLMKYGSVQSGSTALLLVHTIQYRLQSILN